MASVTFEHVTKTFGDTAVVKDMDFHVNDREFLVMVGPSGCGKTTTLRLLAGLDRVTEGKIHIGSRIVNDLHPRERDIAMVFQSYALYPHLSVYNNMAFGLKLRRMSKAEILRRVEHAAGILGIQDLLHRKPQQLSGGECQRVAVGRAIVREPKVFLFDEPLSNLDAKLRVQMRAEISKLHKRLQTTFIYVTHDQVEAMTMASRIAIIDKGVVQQIDTPSNVYHRPNNLFVANFIGSPSMNLFQARLDQNHRDLILDAGIFKAKIPEGNKSTYLPHTGKQVIFGIRPENIHDPKLMPPGLNHMLIEVKVEIVEWMGNEIILHLTSGGRKFIARVDPCTQLNVGETTRIAIDMERFHIFDAETEAAIY